MDAHEPSAMPAAPAAFQQPVVFKVIEADQPFIIAERTKHLRILSLVACLLVMKKSCARAALICIFVGRH
jgi:hypothetical protein